MTARNKALLSACAVLLFALFTALAMITRISPSPRHIGGEKLPW